MGKTHSHIAKDCRVGQVALHTRNRQFFTQMREHGIGNTQITFWVFKVDWVDFVWHGGWAHFTIFEFLFEITQGDIRPYIAVKINQNGIVTAQRVKQFGDIVMWLNLGGIGIKGQPKAGDKVFGIFCPVNMWVGWQVRVVVAHRTIDFT